MQPIREPFVAVSEQDPSAFLRLALQAALASGARQVEIQAEAHALSLRWQPELAWQLGELERVKARIEGGTAEGLEPALKKAATACSLSACRSDLRLRLSIPGLSQSLEVDAQGARWGSAIQQSQACCFAFTRQGEAKPTNPIIDFFSAPKLGPWPELSELEQFLYDAPAKITVNGTAIGRLTLDPPEELEPESIELFRLAIVNHDPRLNNLRAIAQTRTLIHSRSVVEAVLHPLLFACVTPEGELIATAPGASVRAWAAITLHAKPLECARLDPTLVGGRVRGGYPDHILRIVQYGISLAQTRSGVSPMTRVILDGSELETDPSGLHVVDEDRVKQKCLQVSSLYELACRVWQRELENHRHGLENLRVSLHASALSQLKAALPSLSSGTHAP